MKKYQLTVVFDTKEEMTEKGLAFVEEQFGNSNVKVTKQEDLGVKNFAYQVKKQDKGHYYYYEIESDPQSINKMGKEFILQASVLKYLFVAE